MRLRNPLIALGILAGLSAYVYLVEPKIKEKKRKEKEASEHVLPVRSGDVTGLVLERPGEKVRLEKAEGKWKILEPFLTEPDSSSVDQLVQSLDDLHISHDLGKQGSLSAFGLETPAVRVEVLSAGKSGVPPLSLGDEAPTGGGTYARLDDSEKVLVVSSTQQLKSASLFSLRDKSFVKFDPSRLKRFRILRSGDEIDLSRVDEKWRITAPVLTQADDPSVSEALLSLGRLAVSEFVDEKPSASSLEEKGLAPAATRVLLTGEEWEGDRELAFGNDEEGSLFALQPSTGALVRIPDSIARNLGSTVADLRKENLIPFSRFDVSRLRITGIAPEPLELERQGDRDWKRVSPSPGLVSSEGVDVLLRNIGEMRAEGFVNRPGRDVSRYGLDPPAATIELWKSGLEEGDPSRVVVGRPDGEGKVPMKDAAWPPVMMMPAADWDQAKEQALKVLEEAAMPEIPAPPTAPSEPAGEDEPESSSPPEP